MKAFVVIADDWEGVYLDGKLVIEGHSVSAVDILRAIGIEAEYVTASDKWLHDRGSLPSLLCDVKKAK